MESIDVDLTAPFPSYTDRYFSKKFKTNVRGAGGEDQCVLVHSNKLFVICVAPSHPLIAEKKEITSVSFKVSENVDHLENKAGGKFKKNATSVTEWSPLCRVFCSDGSEYTLCSCVRGRLIEVNENLLVNPRLLSGDPLFTGYIGIVMTELKTFKNQVEALTSEKEYLEEVTKRSS